MRLIDADELMDNKVWLCGGFVGDKYAEGYMDGLDAVEEVIKAMPTVDAVPVVRCKNCRFLIERKDGTLGYYRNFMDSTELDNF